jgi:hypothetical protein
MITVNLLKNANKFIIEKDFYFYFFRRTNNSSWLRKGIFLEAFHYDLIEDHDMNWLSKKPEDLRQVTQEYTVFTANYWPAFMNILRRNIAAFKPPVKEIIQLGDLSEGLAGSPEKARQMAGNAMKVIHNFGMSVPWIITKGNHDITGPGAVDAFNEFYLPEIGKQTHNPDLNNANYSYFFDKVQVTCIDPWDKTTDIVSFLEKELSRSDAAVKFVAVHEPVIPVTERCWHLFRNEPEIRKKLLEVIARNKAIVLCAHLHRYSVVRRETPYGPVVQVMVVSVVRDSNYLVPQKVITEYGSSLAEAVPEWQPETMEQRKQMLSDESRFITYYKQTDLPGYAIIKINSRTSNVKLEYFAAFGKKPYDKINISGMLKKLK